MAGFARAGNFAGTPLDLGKLEQTRQASSYLHPYCSMGWAAYATLGCVYGYYRKLIVVLPLLYLDSG
jgi:hypothetical protein